MLHVVRTCTVVSLTCGCSLVQFAATLNLSVLATFKRYLKTLSLCFLLTRDCGALGILNYMYVREGLCVNSAITTAITPNISYLLTECGTVKLDLISFFSLSFLMTPLISHRTHISAA